MQVRDDGTWIMSVGAEMERSGIWRESWRVT